MAFPVNCGLCQKENIPRGLLDQHLSVECMEIQSVCLFLHIGCEESQVSKMRVSPIYFMTSLAAN